MFYFREKLARRDDDALINSSGTEISRNIARLAERRSDIFGVGAQGGEQTSIGRKLGEDEISGPPQPVPRNIWDGQQSTIDATTRFAQQQAQQERMAASNPPPVVPIPTSVQITSSAPIPQAPVENNMVASFSEAASFDQYGAFDLKKQLKLSDFLDDGPSSKRPRLEENLEPEEVWVRKVQGTISILLISPVSSEWNLEGQTFGLNAAITSSVNDLKSQIQDKTTVPASKQKLSFEGIFLKDTNSLAYYNMQNGSTVHLQFKERGGRKK